MTMTHREKIDKVLDLYPEMSHTMVIPESSCDAMLARAGVEKTLREGMLEQTPPATAKHPGFWIKGYLQQAIKSNEPAAVKAFVAKALADWFLAYPEMRGSK